MRALLRILAPLLGIALAAAGGLVVIEVNIAVNDIQLPGAEDGTDALVAPPHARVE